MIRTSSLPAPGASPRVYKTALLSQGAVNVSGLVHSLSEMMGELRREARERGQGTDYVNRHPVVRLFAEQIMHLTCSRDYFEAHRICEEKAAEDKEGPHARDPQPKAG